MKKLIVLSALAAMAVACGGSDVKAEDPSTATTTSESTDKNAPATDSTTPASTDSTAAPASTESTESTPAPSK